MRWNRFEIWVKRRLSLHPRLKRLASVLRRRLPRWRQGVAARHWDQRVTEVETGGPQGWLDSELVEREHIRPQISGDPDVSYLEHFCRRHVFRSSGGRPAGRVLSLGCGGGNLERALLHLGAAEKIDAYDESPESIDLARDLARREGMEERIRYQVADVNRIALEPAAYDVAIAKMALHHFERLEHVCGEVRQALRPGGLFMFNEFVGPSRFQWTDPQLRLMNRMLEALPESIRRRAPVAKIVRPLLADMIAQDPSESVRSAEILPVVEERFEIVERKPYGGTLLHILLSHVLPLFDLEDQGHLACLRLLMLTERTLVEHGVVSSDFVYVVARRPS